MTPTEAFKKERVATVGSYGQDVEFREASEAWRAQSMAKRYVYNFDWMGRPIIQYPQDMVAIQELIWETRPDLIIEAGVAHGGSLIMSASLLAMLDMCDAIEAGQTLDPIKSARKVIGLDIDIRDHNRAAIESHPMASRIKMFEGSSIDPAIVAAVKEAAKGYERVMVCLDSMHTHDHVIGELNAYAGLTSPGCYCVVFDTFVEDVPDELFPDRPWAQGNNPKTAVWEYLKLHPEFEIDTAMFDKLQISVCPDGFLKRIK